jgi:hypothetical protein
MAENLLKSPTFWFIVLAVAAAVGPYAVRVAPTTSRDWVYIAITVAFLAWLLPLMVSLRSSYADMFT